MLVLFFCFFSFRLFWQIFGFPHQQSLTPELLTSNFIFSFVYFWTFEHLYGTPPETFMNGMTSKDIFIVYIVIMNLWRSFIIFMISITLETFYFLGRSLTPGPTQSHKSRSHCFHLVLLFSICIYIATGWQLFCICFPCIVGSVVGEASVVLDIRLEVPAATPLITRIQGYKKTRTGKT